MRCRDTNVRLDSVLRAHWSHERMYAINAAYLLVHGETLANRVKDEMRWQPNYRDVTIALIKDR